MSTSLSLRGQSPLRRFARDRSGHVAIAFALGCGPMLALAGTAIDYGRAVQARDNLRSATEAVTLAIARGAATGLDGDLSATASHLLARAGQGAATRLERPPMVSADRTRVCLDTSASIETNFMRVAGLTTVLVTASACANAHRSDFEIAFDRGEAGKTPGYFASTATIGAGR